MTDEQRAKHALHQRTYKLRHPDRVREVDRAYGATPGGRAARERARNAFRRRNPDVVAAHNAVTKAILLGRLVKGPCAECGLSKVDAHHHRGYDREHRLDIVWLCRPHHQEAHR